MHPATRRPLLEGLARRSCRSRTFLMLNQRSVPLSSLSVGTGHCLAARAEREEKEQVGRSRAYHSQLPSPILSWSTRSAIPSTTCFVSAPPRHLSTAAATAAATEEPASKPAKKSKRSGRKKLDPIVLTERAADRIKELLAGESAEGAIGIRLGVKRRGCNGLSYTLNYAFEKPEKDEEMEAHGVKIFIEPMALFNVVGTTMDWEETELSSEFTFKNPNAKGLCGCGESFNV